MGGIIRNYSNQYLWVPDVRTSRYITSAFSENLSCNVLLQDAQLKEFSGEVALPLLEDAIRHIHKSAEDLVHAKGYMKAHIQIAQQMRYDRHDVIHDIDIECLARNLDDWMLYESIQKVGEMAFMIWVSSISPIVKFVEETEKLITKTDDLAIVLSRCIENANERNLVHSLRINEHFITPCMARLSTHWISFYHRYVVDAVISQELEMNNEGKILDIPSQPIKKK